MKTSDRFAALLALLATFIAPAQAAIKIETAIQKNSVAYVTGNGAAKGAQITWQGSAVTTANKNNGGFGFYGVLPASCTGTLKDGVSTIQVTILYCTPVAAGPPAPVAKTGQTTSYSVGDDGYLQKGIPSPNPRFTDNNNGTITDNLTGLIWMKNANCSAISQKTWSEALTAVGNLADGICGLSDGSLAGDWRLPNVRELQSLVDYGRFGAPSLPFTNFQDFYYWSSTSYAGYPGFAWLVDFYGFLYNSVENVGKDYSYGYVIAVRGGS